MKHLSNNRGQGLIEYMVIVALMAIATMGIMRILSSTTNIRIARIVQSLQGGGAKMDVQIERITESDLRKKDMSNFFNGSRSRRDK